MRLVRDMTCVKSSSLRWGIMSAVLGGAVGALCVFDGIKGLLIVLGAGAVALCLLYPMVPFVALCITASWERFGTVTFGRFHAHPAEIASLVFATAVYGRSLWNGRAVSVSRLWAPAVTFGFVVVCSILWSVSASLRIGYAAWLVSDLVCVYIAAGEYLSSSQGWRKGVAWYLWGVVIASVFGLVQFALGVLHVAYPLVTEIGLHGIPRANGFSYEPSYYALYLVSGVSVAASLWIDGCPAYTTSLVRWAAVLGGAAAVLSMARTGWLGLGVLGVALVVRSWPSGRTRRRAVWLVAGCVVCLALGLVLLPSAVTKFAEHLFASGFNVNNAASIRPRLAGMLAAALAFFRHPILGVGIGGEGAYLVAHFPALVGANTPARGAVATNVWLEIAVETGVVGFAVFLWLIGRHLRALKEMSRGTRDELSYIARAFLLSTAITFGVTFQFSPTVERTDVWVLLAVGAAAIRAWHRRVDESGSIAVNGLKTNGPAG